jgi:amino acid transporter
MNQSQKIVALPLIGLIVGWSFFMVASWSNLFVMPEFDANGMWLNDGGVVRASTYLFLAGIAAFSLMSLQALRSAVALRSTQDQEDPLTRAGYRFANVSVIIGLAGSVIFGITNFFSAFNRFGNDEPLVNRLVGVYLPIVLAAALVVVVILVAFVYRPDASPSAEDKKASLSRRQKAMGLAYAIPIIAGAVAIVFGLVVYDITQTSLEAWVWVVIQVIIATGIILGTRFARQAKAEKPQPPKPRTALASGAWNLNFVLSILFGAVVSIMAFVFGAQSFEQLRDYKFDYAGWDVKPFTFNWFLGDFSPALVLILLVAIGLYATITERHREAPSPR